VCVCDFLCVLALPPSLLRTDVWGVRVCVCERESVYSRAGFAFLCTAHGRVCVRESVLVCVNVQRTCMCLCVSVCACIPVCWLRLPDSYPLMCVCVCVCV